MKLKFALDPIRNPSVLGTTAAQLPMAERLLMMQRVMGEFNQEGYGYGGGVWSKPFVWAPGSALVKGTKGELLFAPVDADLLSVAVRPSKAGPQIEMKVRDWMKPFDGSPPEVKTLLGAPGEPLQLRSNPNSGVMLSFDDPIVTGIMPAGANAALRLRDLAGNKAFRVTLQGTGPFETHPFPQTIVGITERTVDGEQVFAVEFAPARLPVDRADSFPPPKGKVVLTKAIQLDSDELQAQSPTRSNGLTLTPGDPRLAGTPSPVTFTSAPKVVGPDLRKVPKAMAPKVLEAWRKMVREYRVTSRVRIQVRPNAVLLTDPLRYSGGQIAVTREGKVIDNYNPGRVNKRKISELGF